MFLIHPRKMAREGGGAARRMTAMCEIMYGVSQVQLTAGTYNSAGEISQYATLRPSLHCLFAGVYSLSYGWVIAEARVLGVGGEASPSQALQAVLVIVFYFLEVGFPNAAFHFS